MTIICWGMLFAQLVVVHNHSHVWDPPVQQAFLLFAAPLLNWTSVLSLSSRKWDSLEFCPSHHVNETRRDERERERERERRVVLIVYVCLGGHSLIDNREYPWGACIEFEECEVRTHLLYICSCAFAGSFQQSDCFCNTYTTTPQLASENIEKGRMGAPLWDDLCSKIWCYFNVALVFRAFY
jgi:hypothetical protein